MAYVEKTGKSVEEAVAEALKELNITADEAEIEIIEEPKKGFLGFGRKDAKVRVTAKAASTPEVTEETAPSKKNYSYEAAETEVYSKSDVPSVEASAEAKEASEEGSVVEESAQEEERAYRRGYGTPRGERPYREPRRYAVNDEAVTAAREFLQKVFTAMKIDVVMEKFINKADGAITFKLHGEDMGILIGKHGQTLDSLQYLANLVANKNSTDRVRVIIDVEDYRDRRVETLTRLANRLADKVKRTGERVALEPMNPHERKIIHMALQGDRRVTTLSEGDDNYRHVVIELKNKY